MYRTLSRAALALVAGGSLAMTSVAIASPTACGDKTAAPNKAVPADAAKTELVVAGMTCDGCANAIHNALMGTDGVFAAEVSYENGKATVRYDAKKLKVEDLVAVVTKAGYKASASKS